MSLRERYPKLDEFELELESIDGQRWTSFREDEDERARYLLNSTAAVPLLLSGDYVTILQDGHRTRCRLTPKKLNDGPKTEAHCPDCGWQMINGKCPRDPNTGSPEGGERCESYSPLHGTRLCFHCGKHQLEHPDQSAVKLPGAHNE